MHILTRKKPDHSEQGENPTDEGEQFLCDPEMRKALHKQDVERQREDKRKKKGTTNVQLS